MGQHRSVVHADRDLILKLVTLGLESWIMQAHVSSHAKPMDLSLPGWAADNNTIRAKNTVVDKTKTLDG